MTRPPLRGVAIVAILAVAPAHADQPKALTPEALAARLAKVSGEKLELIDREKDLLADAAGGKLSRVSLAEAALLASGVREEAARKKYLDRIDVLERDARKAVADAKTPFDTGAHLLKWLHGGPMANGYSPLQDHLPDLLDEGKFNCVSATIVYAVLGKRLGLDVRGVVVPAHALAIQYDGSASKDVETTSARGFDGNKKYIIRREVGDFGLVATVYRNTLARHNRAGQYPEMIRAGLFSYALDPKDHKQAEDVYKGFNNWWVSRAKKDQFPEALDVIALGLEAQPDNDRLRNARVDVYGLWAKTHRQKSEWAAGAKLLVDARTAHPRSRGLDREIERHYLLWSRADPDKAAEVLQDGLKALPDSYSLKTELARVKKKDK